MKLFNDGWQFAKGEPKNFVPVVLEIIQTFIMFGQSNFCLLLVNKKSIIIF
ncbi:MAG: hypothetical protein ACYDG2_06430 [Ruminiclostridium sp.]